jgi:hypothetical protein
MLQRLTFLNLDRSTESSCSQIGSWTENAAPQPDAIDDLDLTAAPRNEAEQTIINYEENHAAATIHDFDVKFGN